MTERDWRCRALGLSQVLGQHEPSQNLQEMLRGRGQHGEFPRAQPAQGESSQMETVSVSEGIAAAAAAGTRAGEGMGEKRGGEASERWITLERRGEKEKGVGKGCASAAELAAQWGKNHCA